MGYFKYPPIALLPAPGNRDDSVTYKLGDGSTTTTYSKGKRYVPKKSDRRKSAGRAKALKSKSTPNPSLFPGAKEMISLGRGVTESKETNYNEVERSILEVSKEIKDIVAKLEETRTKNENKT